MSLNRIECVRCSPFLKAFDVSFHCEMKMSSGFENVDNTRQGSKRRKEYVRKQKQFN